MPITQARLIALLDAAEQCRDCVSLLRDAITTATRMGLTPCELVGLTVDTKVPDSVRDLLATERAHAKHTRARNASEARRLARRRAELRGEPPPTFAETPPEALDPFDLPDISDEAYAAFQKEKADREKQLGKVQYRNGLPLG